MPKQNTWKQIIDDLTQYVRLWKREYRKLRYHYPTSVKGMLVRIDFNEARGKTKGACKMLSACASMIP